MYVLQGATLAAVLSWCHDKLRDIDCQKIIKEEVLSHRIPSRLDEALPLRTLAAEPCAKPGIIQTVLGNDYTHMDTETFIDIADDHHRHQCVFTDFARAANEELPACIRSGGAPLTAGFSVDEAEIGLAFASSTDKNRLLAARKSLRAAQSLDSSIACKAPSLLDFIDQTEALTNEQRRDLLAHQLPSLQRWAQGLQRRSTHISIAIASLQTISPLVLQICFDHAMLCATSQNTRIGTSGLATSQATLVRKLLGKGGKFHPRHLEWSAVLRRGIQRDFLYALEDPTETCLARVRPTERQLRMETCLK